jgi:hypothetical protein
MREARAIVDGPSMAESQGATRPAWLGRSRWRLLGDVVGGLRQNWDKLVQLISLLAAYFRPGLVRGRLERLRALGHVDTIPTIPQLLVAGRDQMIVSAAAETKLFYKSQGIPWVFHNFRRFVSGRRRCWTRSVCSRRATRSCTTCCRRFIAIRSTTSCCCARTTMASRRWRRRRGRWSRGRTRTSVRWRR